MGVVDNVVVGHVSGDAMAAVALGHLYSFSLIVFGFGVLLALDPLISQAVGAEDDEAAARTVQRGLLVAALLAVALAAAHWPAASVFRLLGQREAIVPAASAFVRASIPGLPAVLCVMVMRQSLQARGRLRPILVAIVLANVVNGVLAWSLVFGRLGVPALGVVGSGWATSASRWFLALALATIGWKDLRSHLVPWRRAAFEPASLGRLALLGLPIGVQGVLDIGAYAAGGLILGARGPGELAGHQVALSLASWSINMPAAVSIATSIRVGNAVGRGEMTDARCAAGAAAAIGAVLGTAVALLLFLAPEPLARLYVSDDSVVAVACALVPIAGLSLLFDSVQIIASGALRGAGESRFPAVANLVAHWGVGLPLGWWLTTRTSLGARGVWCGLTLALGLVASVLSWRAAFKLSGDVRRLDVETAR
jgi:MATE family multidrug resistance protein